MINLLLLYWRLDNRLDHLSTCCYFLWAELVLHLPHQILPVPGVYSVSCFAVLELRFRPWGESAAMMMELKLRAEKSSSGRIMINYCNSNKLCIMYLWTNRRYKIVYFKNDYGSKKSESLKGMQKGVYAKILGFGSSLNLLSATIQIYFPIPVIYSTGIRKIPRDFTIIKKLCIHIISSKLLELTTYTLKYRTETNPNMQDS